MQNALIAQNHNFSLKNTFYYIILLFYLWWTLMSVSIYECPTTKSDQVFIPDMTFESYQWFADKATNGTKGRVLRQGQW